MEQSNIIKLLEKGVEPKKSVWADLGSGDGVFTLALKDLAGPKAEIYSIDKNAKKLKIQKELFIQKFPDAKFTIITTDFTQPIDLPILDGILMANALHFVKDKISLLERLKNYLKPTGKILFVEYDTDNGNFFVPYPLSASNLEQLLTRVGFYNPQLLATAPSSYWNQMYSIQAFKP